MRLTITEQYAQMLKCPRCGSGVPVGARFCMQCGCQFAAVPASGGHAVAGALVPTAQNRTGWLMLFAVLAVAGVAFGLGASGIFGARGAKDGVGLLASKTGKDTGFMNQQGGDASGIMQARGGPDTGVTQMPMPEKVKMPDDIRDWLEHLRKTEEKRVALAQKQLAVMLRTAAMLSLGGADKFLEAMAKGEDDPAQPHEEVKDDVAAMREEWKDVNTFFDSKKPPEECVPIYNEYSPALRETGAMISDILEPLSGSIENKADQDTAIERLLKIQNTSKSHIDEPAMRTDDLVQKICDKYDTPKWFKIVGDIAAGNGVMQSIKIPTLPKPEK